MYVGECTAHSHTCSSNTHLWIRLCIHTHTHLLACPQPAYIRSAVGIGIGGGPAKWTWTSYSTTPSACYPQIALCRYLMRGCVHASHLAQMSHVPAHNSSVISAPLSVLRHDSCTFTCSPPWLVHFHMFSAMTRALSHVLRHDSCTFDFTRSCRFGCFFLC